jgi:Tat protein translocase TatB subunit
MSAPVELTPRDLFLTLDRMFGMGMPELLVCLVVALIVLGPKRLPEVARTLGRALAEFRRATGDMMDEFQVHTMLDDETPRKKPASPKAAAADEAPAAPASNKPDAGRA